MDLTHNTFSLVQITTFIIHLSVWEVVGKVASGKANGVIATLSFLVSCVMYLVVGANTQNCDFLKKGTIYHLLLSTFQPQH